MHKNCRPSSIRRDSFPLSLRRSVLRIRGTPFKAIHSSRQRNENSFPAGPFAAWFVKLFVCVFHVQRRSLDGVYFRPFVTFRSRSLCGHRKFRVISGGPVLHDCKLGQLSLASLRGRKSNTSFNRLLCRVAGNTV